VVVTAIVVGAGFPKLGVADGVSAVGGELRSEHEMVAVSARTVERAFNRRIEGISGDRSAAPPDRELFGGRSVAI
jgi:hypothetical protein